MKIISVVGARPNFMKIAPFIHAIDNHNMSSDLKIDHHLVHTGQHYDDRMSASFFNTLNIPPADINLEIGSGTHAEQVGHTMIAFEKVLELHKPDWVVVVGDVNATLACSVTAKKMGVKCCHIEAGLRSGDLNMPEEINRLVTDRLSDLLLTPDRMSSENLLNEGVPPEKIEFVGNIMIDTLDNNLEKASKLSIPDIILENSISNEANKINGFGDFSEYGLITMHRPSNVDDETIFKSLVNWITEVASNKVSFIWPIHPRTVKQAQAFGVWDQLVNCDRLILLHPLGYHEMLRLNLGAKLMLTDSGGLQEECCVLGTPFLTLRWNTERPVTLLKYGGAGYLVGNNIVQINHDFEEIMASVRNPLRPELWDGSTAKRCLNAILNF